MAELTKAQKDAAYHLGVPIARHLDAAALAVMRADVERLDLGDGSPASAGWRFMDAALAQAWAVAQAGADLKSGAPPLPETGPAPACDRPALYFITAYRRDVPGGTQYGTITATMRACGAHVDQYRDRLAAEFTTAHAHPPNPSVDGQPCGYRFNFKPLATEDANAGS